MTDANIYKEYAATPGERIEQYIMDPRHPKSEGEWWASREITRLREENEKLREALEVIVNPIPAMQKQAEIDCVNLSGVMSIQIADSVNFLRSIARKALKSGDE